MDNLVEAALDAVCNEVISSIGEPQHEDPEIAQFLRSMLDRMHGENGYSLHDCLYHMLKTELWAGFQVTESVFDFWDGKLVLDDLVTYHPSTITIVPDEKGRLKENRQTHSDYRKSGIYQHSLDTHPEVQIPLWKTFHSAHQARFGNYYGRSVISSIYKWHRLRETLIDMMTIALDRFGNPLLWVKTGPSASGRTETNPATGEEYQVSPQQEIEEQMEDMQGDGNVIVLTQSQPEIEPKVGTLTTGNDVGTTFLEAIDYAAEQIAVGLYPPFFLLSDRTRIDNDTLIERRMDQFKNLMAHKRKKLVESFCKKILWRPILYNFNRDSAQKPPTLSYVQSSRQEKLVDKMQAVKGLTEDGYINPKNTIDWQSVRQMISATPREMEEKDKQFIHKMLVAPKEKDTVGSNARSSTTNSQTRKSDPDRGKQGQNVSGRPSGSSNPQVNPRSSTN